MGSPIPDHVIRKLKLSVLISNALVAAHPLVRVVAFGWNYRSDLKQGGVVLGTAVRCRAARAMLLDYSRQGSQRLVRLSWAWERGSYIGLQDHYSASRRVPRCVLVARGATEVILRKDLVGVNLINGFAFMERFLHSSFVHGGLPVAR